MITKDSIIVEDGGYLGGEHTDDITPVTPGDDEVVLAWRCGRAIATPAQPRD